MTDDEIYAAAHVNVNALIDRLQEEFDVEDDGTDPYRPTLGAYTTFIAAVHAMAKLGFSQEFLIDRIIVNYDNRAEYAREIGN
jgi:hypothetical protein